MEKKTNKKQGSFVTQILGAVLAVILLIFGIGELHDAFREKKELLEINESKLRAINDDIKNALKYIMILDHREEVGILIDLLRKTEEIDELRILKVNGTEAFSPTPSSQLLEEKEKSLPKSTHRESSQVMREDDPHLLEVLETEKGVKYREENGESKLTYLSPIISEKRCIQCHGANQPVLGVVKISFSTAEVEKSVRSNILRSTIFFFITLLLSGVILFILLNRIVKQPMQKFLGTIQDISGGDMTKRVGLTSKNEFGEMATAFDHMADQLEKSQSKLHEYSLDLEEKVKERTSQLEEKIKDLNNTRRAVLNVLEDATAARKAAEESEASARSYANQLQALHEATQTLVSSLDIQEVSSKCAIIAKELIGADGAAVFLVDKEMDRLTPIFVDDPYSEFVMKMSLKVGEGVTGEVAESGKAIMANRVDVTGKGVQIPGTKVEPESLLSAPLTIKKKVIGVITIRRLGVREFYDEDLEFLMNLANVSAAAIQNARLYAVVQQSERDYRSLVETAVDPVIAIDENSQVLVWNEAATKTFGFEEKEILGQSFEVIFPSKTGFKKHIKELKNFLQTGQSKILEKTLELRAKRKDGHLIDILLSISARHTEHGWVFTALIKDITEVKKARREINRLANFPKENPLPVIELDSKGNITYMNPACLNLLKKMRLTKEAFNRILPPNYEEMVLTCVKTGKDIPAQEVAIDSIVLLWTGHCLEKLNLVHLYATDITELKKTEEELRAAKEKAEESDRLKNVFLSTMSHEVRTPLNVLLGYSDVLATSMEKKLTGEEKELFQAIQESGLRLKSLIDDILDVSLIEADRTVLNMESLLADEVVKLSVSEMRLAANKKKLQVIENYGAPKTYIYVDKIRLQQALGNILQNAVKFTHKGSITVQTWVEENEYHVSVTDTGIGIKEEFKPYLFTLFRQEEEGYSRSYEGAGLGLSISQGLVLAMGGRIEVKSERGKGSTFTLRFPVKARPEKKVKVVKPHKKIEKPVKRVKKLPSRMPPKIAGKKKKKTILILEDNPANIKYLEFLVKRLGYNSISTDMGEKALKLIRNNTIDCMLIDISLAEGMSGIEFLKRAKQDKNFKDIPMIAATAYAMKGQREKLLKEGFNDYLAKPFTIKDLEEVLNRHLKNE